MLIENIVYSDEFNSFLDSLNSEKVAIIKVALNSFAKGEEDLDPKDCEHFENRRKIAIGNADVVVYYDIDNNDMVMIGGCNMEERVA